MIDLSVLRLDAAKKTSTSARASTKLKCKIEQCGGRCLRAGEVCRLVPTKEQSKVWGAANKAAKKAKPESQSSSGATTGLSVAELRKRELERIRQEVYDSPRALWERSLRLSGDRLAALGNAVERHYSLETPLKNEEWGRTIETYAKNLWDIAGTNPSIPETARERIARFLGDKHTREVLSAPKGGLSDETINKIFQPEEPVSRASLLAATDPQKMGQAGPIIEKWAKELGQTAWQKATPAQKAKILVLLSPDLIEKLGIEFKKPAAAAKLESPPRQEEATSTEVQKRRGRNAAIANLANSPLASGAAELRQNRESNKNRNKASNKLDTYTTIGGRGDTQKIKKLIENWDAASKIPGAKPSWVSEVIASKAGFEPESFKGVLDSKGNLQAGMLLTKGRDSVEIDYLATAPWNRPDFPDGRRAAKYKDKAVKGAGTAAIIEAVKESQKNGFKGKVTLYALGDAVPFYKKLGFEHQNPEEKEVWGGSSSMYLSPERAAKLVSSYDNKNNATKKKTKTNGTAKTRTRTRNKLG